MRLTHCTLTGIDDRTDLSMLATLSGRYAHAEWGFLYSPKRQGQPGRYPAVATLCRAFEGLPASVRVALHVCGDGVQDLVAGESVVTDLVALVGQRGGRVQLNFNLGKLSHTARMDARLCSQDDHSGKSDHPFNSTSLLCGISRVLAHHPLVTFIAQYHAQNHAAYEVLRGRPNFAVLFDRSGGTGRLPDRWPAPLGDVPCGYAGGLGPDNLVDQLDVIAETAGERDIWIDMENNLRTRDGQGVDWFDLRHAGLCLDITAGLYSDSQDSGA